MKKIALLASAVFMTTAMSFDDGGYPTYMSKGEYINDFNSLPLSSELSVDRLPWASSFWPSIYGGIAFRWNNYHTTEPYFAQLHYKVNDINDEIDKLNHELFVQNQSSSNAAAIHNRILELEQEKRNVVYQKSGEHEKVMFDYSRPNRLEDVQRMSDEQVNKLSPAEKFDVYKMLIGESNRFYLTDKVLDRKTGPYKAYWEGICHGWSTAALEFKEPKPVTINKQGVKLTFQSSDLKGLLSQYHAQITGWPDRAMVTNQYGKRCGVEFPAETWHLDNGVESYQAFENGAVVKNSLPSECVDDVDAGGFHLVLANQIAILKKGFVVEATRDREVWNQPVFGYNSEILEEGSSLYLKRNNGTAKQVRVKTVMKYANDGGRMYWEQDAADDEFYAWENRTSGTSNYRFASKTYEYILDLDRKGDIIGGHWLSYERPDFLWIKRNKGFIRGRTRLTKYMNDLKNLVEIR